MKESKAFTLIELLIVIAIIAILGSATVLVLNPVEIIKQGRDGTRITDVENIQKSLNLTLFNNPSLVDSLLSTNIYLSLPSGSCPLSPPTGYTYVCNATSANINKTDGTGWIPLTLQNMASLPTDPNSNFYYAFIANPTTKTFTVTALLESEKQTKLSAAKDGGTDPGRFEKGDAALWALASGLIGYYPLDEGSGSTASDLSGKGNHGTWAGAGTHYATGKVGMAGNFDGDDYVNLPNLLNGAQNFTVSFWFNTNIVDVMTGAFCSETAGTSWRLCYFYDSIRLRDNDGLTHDFDLFSSTMNNNRWYHVVMVHNAATLKTTNYVDGVSLGDVTTGSTMYSDAGSTKIGNTLDPVTYNYKGLVDEVRVYNRALTVDEVKAIHNGHK